MPNLRLLFECPICGLDGFTQVEIRGRDGVRRLIEAYECKGCSTKFRDRDRFTKRRVRVIGADGVDLGPSIAKRQDEDWIPCKMHRQESPSHQTKN